jgi:hypothetical protein
MIVCDTPDKIEAFRLLALRGALKLECKGLRRKGQSVATLIKREFNLRGTKQQLSDQFEALLRERGILV